METKFDGAIEIFNEVITLLICYMMICLTDFIPEPETRYSVGFIYITILGLHFLTHIVAILTPPILKLRDRIRFHYIKKAKKKRFLSKRRLKSICSKLSNKPRERGSARGGRRQSWLKRPAQPRWSLSRSSRLKRCKKMILAGIVVSSQATRLSLLLSSIA